MGADGFDRLDDVHALGDGAEDGVLTVEPARGGRAQEELRAVRVRAGVRHGQDARAGVLEREVFIRKLGAVDGLAARAVVIGEVTALAHEARDHAVERRSGVAETVFTRAKRAEVLCDARKRTPHPSVTRPIDPHHLPPPSIPTRSTRPVARALFPSPPRADPINHPPPRTARPMYPPPDASIRTRSLRHDVRAQLHPQNTPRSVSQRAILPSSSIIRAHRSRADRRASVARARASSLARTHGHFDRARGLTADLNVEEAHRVGHGRLGGGRSVGGGGFFGAFQPRRGRRRARAAADGGEGRVDGAI